MTLKRISSSIRTQFLIVMLLLIVVPVITGAIVTYYYFGGFIQDSQNKNIEALRQANAFSLHNYLQNQKSDLTLIARAPSVVTFATKMQKFMKTNQWNSNSLQTNFTKDRNAVEQLLSSLATNPIYLIDVRSGLIFFQSNNLNAQNPKALNAKFNDPTILEFINKIAAQQKIIISDCMDNTTLQETLCFLGAPITDASHRVIGVVLMQESPSVLSRHLTTDFSAVQGAEVYLVNDAGRLLAHTAGLEPGSASKMALKRQQLNANGPFFGKNLQGKSALTTVKQLPLNDLFSSAPHWYLVAQIEKAALAGPFNSLRLYLILIVLILSALGLIIVFWLSRLVSTPIETINYTLNEVTRGNLKVEVPTFDYGNELDELSENLQTMVKQLHGQISNVTEHINNISASSTEISATISQVTASSSETASAITETASSSEEVAQLAQSFDEKAKDALALSNETAEASEKSQQAIQAIYNVIGQVKTQIDEVANSMVSLSKQSQTISEITAVVQEIAEQSNILAINASIEATKAGEYGRSFAVVANEVRNLAEQSKKATQQIRSILDAIQESVTRSVMQVEQTGKIVSEGSTHMAYVNNAVELLSGSIDKMIQLVSEVAESSHEQLEGTAQIKEAMENIKQATAQNLDGMRQMEEVITGLKQTAINLKEMISQYQL